MAAPRTRIALEKLGALGTLREEIRLQRVQENGPSSSAFLPRSRHQPRDRVHRGLRAHRAARRRERETPRTASGRMSPAPMHVPLGKTQIKRKIPPPHAPPARQTRTKAQVLFHILLQKKRTTHLHLIKSIYVGTRLINSPSTREPSHCVRLNEVLERRLSAVPGQVVSRQHLCRDSSSCCARTEQKMKRVGPARSG